MLLLLEKLAVLAAAAAVAFGIRELLDSTPHHINIPLRPLIHYLIILLLLFDQLLIIILPLSFQPLLHDT